MAEIIEFQKPVLPPDEPDAKFVRKDDYGKPLYCYNLHYQFERGTWALKLWAYSREDAEARVAAIRESVEYFGQIMGEVPA